MTEKVVKSESQRAGRKDVASIVRNEKVCFPFHKPNKFGTPLIHELETLRRVIMMGSTDPTNNNNNNYNNKRETLFWAKTNSLDFSSFLQSKI